MKLLKRADRSNDPVLIIISTCKMMLLFKAKATPVFPFREFNED
jgi:hypothetical protein